MAIIKIQFNKQIRKYNGDSQNIQLGKIYNFILKNFENVPTYFELQYRHPLNKIKRQLMNNDQLYDLLQIKSNITLIVKPIISENISRYQICRKRSEQLQSGIFSDMAMLLENLSLHHNFSESSANSSITNNNQIEKECNNNNKSFMNKFFFEDSDEQQTQQKLGVSQNIIQDEKDFLIKDETSEYVEQLFCLSSDDDSSQQIELNF